MRLWQTYYTATSVEDVVSTLAEHGERARIMAGGTDLIIEIQNGTRAPDVVVDITRVGGLNRIRQDDEGTIYLGPMVTHAQAAASPLLQEHALPLAQACWWVGAPALRNRGTIAGNLVTASPANDTITALWALDARLTLRSTRGSREVPIADFYKGVRRTVMEPDELLTDIAFPALTEAQSGIYLKIGLRRILAIAVTNIAVVITMQDGSSGEGAPAITDARIALGSVAPTIIRAREAEAALAGGALTDERIARAALRAREASRPIDDVRGSAWYREEEVAALTRRALEHIRAGDLRMGMPEPSSMVKLWGKTRRCPRLSGPTIAHHADGDEPIQTVVNGENVTVRGANGKTLLRMLREDLGLTGSKAGCEEGECGSCTVWLDGIATLACLTPAPRAHGAHIETIEGLSAEGELHPVQEAFVEEDAVQCGYCTPGFVMSAAKLLEEFPAPDREQIKTALSGNLCRCTGYYKIITAVEKAARR
ncbi:MAG: FAD binding domain-containing protein [Anaerolineae bacterium]|nr:FAD binding domain-containing protein [Anaerolineae bacterium]